MNEKDLSAHVGERYGIYTIVGFASKNTPAARSLYIGQCEHCGFMRYAQLSGFKRIITTCKHIHRKQVDIVDWYEEVKKKCGYCGQFIPRNDLKQSAYLKRKFCNIECFKRFKQNNVAINYCKNCGVSIQSNRTYCSPKCQFEFIQNKWEKQWLNGDTDGNTGIVWRDTSKRVRTYLFKKYDNKCSRCGWSERNPYTGKIPLEIENIDGNPSNTIPSNVTLLCPNCHSLTSTYKGANKGKGRGRSRTWYPDIRDD